MTMYSQYISSLMLYTVRNQHLFSSSNSVHQYRTRYNNDLHLPIVNLKKYKDGPYFMAIKLYNHLPQYIKALMSDLKSFKKTLKGFLCQHSLCFIPEYYDIQRVLVGNFHSCKKLIIYIQSVSLITNVYSCIPHMVNKVGNPYRRIEQRYF